jgi:hypothetical protein
MVSKLRLGMPVSDGGVCIFFVAILDGFII